MIPSDHLTDEDLIVYDDYDLAASERQQFSQHLSGCPECRCRLEELRWVDHVLNTSKRKYDDSAHRGQIIETVWHRERGERRVVRVLKMALAVTSIFTLLVFFGQPVTSTAVDGVTRFIRLVSDIDGSDRSSMPAHAEPPGTLYVPPAPGAWNPDDLSFTAVAPEELPFGLHLQGGAVESADRLRLIYQTKQGDEDLKILLTEGPVGEMVVGTSSDDTELELVEGTEVLLGRDDVSEAVVWMFWERDDLAFEALVLEDLAGYMTTERALRLVIALGQAQADVQAE